MRLEYVEEALRERRRFHALALLYSNSGASAEALKLWQVWLPLTGIHVSAASCPCCVVLPAPERCHTSLYVWLGSGASSLVPYHIYM